MTTSNVLLDTTQYVRVNVGLNPLTLQAHRDHVRIVFNEVRPTRNNTAFHLLAGDDAPLQLPFIDTNVWALALTDTSSLTVTEFSLPKVDTIAELAHVFMIQHSEHSAQLNQIVKQLKLLNVRVEEAFETKINEEDMI